VKVAVLGAGAAGLAAGLELQRRGVEVAVFEATRRPGGKLGSIRKDGYLLETGAIGMLDREGDLAPLCARLGLALVEANEAARARYVERDGEVRRLGPGLLRPAELVSLLAHLPFARRPQAEESVARFFARRFGRAGAFLADALQTGIYAGDPEQLELASAFPRIAARGFSGGRRARLSSFAGGVQELVDALAAALGPRLRLGAPVRELSAGFLLDGERFDRVICALPAPEAARLLEPMAPALSSRLRTLTTAPLALVHFGVPEDAIGPRARSFGLLSPGRPVAGVLFPAALFPKRAPAGAALVTAIVGGVRNPAAAALPDDALAALVREHLARVAGLRGAPAPLHIHRWPQAIPQYARGHSARVDELERLAPAGLLFAGAAYRGVSVLDCLRQGTRAAAAASV
jgi:oxygen-dependent protoporphyrinogen oxidase